MLKYGIQGVYAAKDIFKVGLFLLKIGFIIGLSLFNEMSYVGVF